MDDSRGDPRSFAPIATVDILHHLLTPLMFEIDVDVGRFVALFRHETGKKQVVLHRIDGSHAQQEADDGIGGRPPPLAENGRLLGPCETNKVVNRQKIIGIILPANEMKLLIDQLFHFQSQWVAVAFHRRFTHQIFQPTIG